MGRIKKAYDIHLQDDDVHGSAERALDPIKRVLDGIGQSEILNGSLIKDVSLNTTTTRIAHKLNRKFLGYIIVRKNANEDIYEQPDSSQEKFISLIATGPVNISLWVF